MWKSALKEILQEFFKHLGVDWSRKMEKAFNDLVGAANKESRRKEEADEEARRILEMEREIEDIRRKLK